MLVDAVGSLLPAAAGIALSPFPVIAVILILASPEGRTNGVAFAAGWLVGLSLLTAFAVGILGVVDSDDDPGALSDWIRIALGGALLAAAGWKWHTRPTGDDPALPGWMSSIDGATTGRSVRLGFLLGGVNPKNVAFAVAATASIAALVDGGARQFAASAVFVALASTTVVGAVVYRLVAGDRSDATLGEVRRFMVRHAGAITMVVLVLLGSMVVGEGLAGLRD